MQQTFSSTSNIERRTSNRVLFYFAIFFALAFLPARLAAESRYLLHLTGPSVSKHFNAYHDQFNDFHWGLGIEAYYKKNNWLLGVNGHYMFNDSTGRASYWIGVAPGYFVGEQKKIWGSLAVIVGGLKKVEYNQGRFSFFALPYLTVGYRRIGLNILYIPRIVHVTNPILLVQVKILVFPFHRSKGKV